MLYASQWCGAFGLQGKIIQYNITSNDSAIINSSRVNIFTSANESFYSMKLAPDKKIYVGHQFTGPTSGYLGVINNPDSLGLSCNYVDSAVYLNGKHCGWGLNNLMEYGTYCNENAGVNELSNNHEITLCPNPTNSSFTITSTSKIKEVKVYNLLGEEMLSSVINNNQSTINISQFTSGIYFAEIKTEQGIVMKKIIKE